MSQMVPAFPVVMIADHMDESLIQLRRTMCWPMEDIAQPYVP